MAILAARTLRAEILERVRAILRNRRAKEVFRCTGVSMDRIRGFRNGLVVPNAVELARLIHGLSTADSPIRADWILFGEPPAAPHP